MSSQDAAARILHGYSTIHDPQAATPMYVSEFFHSIQGEGELAGVPTVFVRTSGCNLRCWFCDTPYTSWEPEGETLDWQDVLARVLAIECRHVDLTGGEPLLQADLVPLTKAMKAAGRHITIETAGTVFLPVAADLMSISPKLANSTPVDPQWGPRHEQTRHRPDVMRRLLADYACQLKFVVDRPEDVTDVLRYLGEFPEVEPRHVWLMPQARTVEEIREKTPWLQSMAAAHGFRVSPRLHIERWGNVRGK